MNVGAAAKESLKHLLSNKKISDLKVLEIKKESQSVLVALVSKLLEKLPLKYSLVRHADCLDPRQMGSTESEKRDHCIGHMRQLLQVCTK